MPGIGRQQDTATAAAAVPPTAPRPNGARTSGSSRGQYRRPRAFPPASSTGKLAALPGAVVPLTRLPVGPGGRREARHFVRGVFRTSVPALGPCRRRGASERLRSTWRRPVSELVNNANFHDRRIWTRPLPLASPTGGAAPEPRGREPREGPMPTGASPHRRHPTVPSRGPRATPRTGGAGHPTQRAPTPRRRAARGLDQPGARSRAWASPQPASETLFRMVARHRSARRRRRLIADELVTNAVVHAGTTSNCLPAADSPLGAWRWRRRTRPGHLGIEVADTTRRDAPADARAQAPGRTAGPAGPGASPGCPSTAGGCSGRRRSPSAGASPTAPGSRPYGRTAARGRARRPVRGASRLRRGLPPPRSLAPASPRGAPRVTTEWRRTTARSPSSPRPPTCSAGQLDEDLVAALAGQLLVPRLADWCAVWLDGEGAQAGAAPRLARVWHADESRLDAAARGPGEGAAAAAGPAARGAGTRPWPGGDSGAPGTAGMRRPRGSRGPRGRYG